jgi:dTDP-4-amino-4,6-dideoxygalactose transaminase
LFASNRYAERDAASTRPIPFLDLVTQHEALEPELVSVFRRALSTAGFVGGSMVDDFEREFADFCDVRHAVGVASGTDALRFALIAAGVRPGDTVVTVPNTFIATGEAISQAGARPDFVDVDECTYTMSPDALDRYFSQRCVRNAEGVTVHRRTGSPVTAVVPVHLYGQMADMERILAVAAQYKLRVIEDACQAHGAFLGARRAGAVGDADPQPDVLAGRLGRRHLSEALVAGQGEVKEGPDGLRRCRNRARPIAHARSSNGVECRPRRTISK